MLHLDPADVYGGAWGVLRESPDDVGWILPARDERRGDVHAAGRVPLDPNEVPFPARGAPVPSVAYASWSTMCPDPNAAATSLGNRRRFSLDLAAPKLCFGADRFIDALVDSGAHKYCEFKAVNQTWMLWDGRAHPVPASRAEVFRDRSMTPGEKRSLMRLLKRVVSHQAESDENLVFGSGDPDDANVAIGAPGSEWRGLGGASGPGRAGSRHPGAAAGDGGEDQNQNQNRDQTEDQTDPPCPDPRERFRECLSVRHGLSPRLASAVQYALALSDDESVLAGAGFRALGRYVASLGRFGPGVGAALTPAYGAGEFPQAFARVAAVAGATYVLRLPVRSYMLSQETEVETEATAEVEGSIPTGSDGKLAKGEKTKSTIREVTGIVTEGGQTIRCRALATSRCAAPWSVNKNAKKTSDTNGRKNGRRRWVSRGVWIVDGSAFPAGCDLGLLVVPPGRGPPGVPVHAAARVTQLSGAAVAVAPRGTFVLHASVSADADAADEGSTSAEDDLRGVLEMLAETDPVDRADPVDGEGGGSRHPGGESAPGDGDAGGDVAKGAGGVFPGVAKPRLVWGAFYRQSYDDDDDDDDDDDGAPANAATCPEPDASCDFLGAVRGAERAAARLFGPLRDAAGEKLRLFPGATAAAAAGGDVGVNGAGTSPTGGDEEDEMDALLRDIPGLPPAE